MNRAEYSAYLASPEWAVRRSWAIAAAGGRCQVCNASSQLHVHHRTYERIGHEHPADVTVLCAVCHELFHSRLGALNPPVERAAILTLQAVLVDLLNTMFRMMSLAEMNERDSFHVSEVLYSPKYVEEVRIASRRWARLSCFYEVAKFLHAWKTGENVEPLSKDAMLLLAIVVGHREMPACAVEKDEICVAP